MERLNFKQNNIKVVDINLVHPNTWNPKPLKTKEWEKIKEGVRLKGQRLPVIVRNHPTKKGEYEIIDGEQRYRACVDLQYEHIIIYDEGDISDKEAKELTIWYQQQVPFDELELAQLIKDIVENNETVELPYSEKDIEEYLNLLEYDFDKYDTSPIEHKTGLRIKMNVRDLMNYNNVQVKFSDEIEEDTIQFLDTEGRVIYEMKGI